MVVETKNRVEPEDWYGNNAAFRCLSCKKAFIVSAHLDKENGCKRDCPDCGKSTGICTGSKGKKGEAYIYLSDNDTQ